MKEIKEILVDVHNEYLNGEKVEKDDIERFKKIKEKHIFIDDAINEYLWS